MQELDNLFLPTKRSLFSLESNCYTQFNFRLLKDQTSYDFGISNNTAWEFTTYWLTASLYNM